HYRSSARCCWTLRVSVDRAARPSPHTRGKPRLLDVGRRILARDWFAPDSPLEGDGFELSVRGRGQSGCRPFWVGCADRVRAGRAAPGQGGYRRRGWGILPGGVGAARRTARSIKAAFSGLSTGCRRDGPRSTGSAAIRPFAKSFIIINKFGNGLSSSPSNTPP